MAATITQNINGVTYGWSGMFGSTFRSEEYVPVGTVRFLFGELMYASESEKPCYWHPACTRWVPVANVDMDWVRNFRGRFIDG